MNLVTGNRFVYADFSDTGGINYTGIRVYVDNVDVTSQAEISFNDLYVACDGIMVPELTSPRAVTVLVPDSSGNTQTLSVDPQMFDPRDIDPDDDATTTTVGYHLHRSGNVRILIYNVYDGCVYKSAYFWGQSSGDHTYTWDGLGDDGFTVPSGKYCFEISYFDYPEYIASIDPEASVPYIASGYSKSSNLAPGKSDVYSVYAPTQGTVNIHIESSGSFTAALKREEPPSEVLMTKAGSTFDMSYDVDKPGFFNVTVSTAPPGGSYTIGAQFGETAQSRTIESQPRPIRPWNSWYWATSVSPDYADYPHLWDPDDGTKYSPLAKYDQVYGTQTREWEHSENATDPNCQPGGAGHCNGWTLASTFLDSPQDVAVNPRVNCPCSDSACDKTPCGCSSCAKAVRFNKEALKGLLCQVFDHTIIYTTADHGFMPVDKGKDPVRADDPQYAATCRMFHWVLHHGLLTHQTPDPRELAGSPRVYPLNSNMPAKAGEVWNYPIYRYEAKYKADSDDRSDADGTYTITTTVFTPADTSVHQKRGDYRSFFPADNEGGHPTFVYKLRFHNGESVSDGAQWISSTRGDVIGNALCNNRLCICHQNPCSCSPLCPSAGVLPVCVRILTALEFPVEGEPDGIAGRLDSGQDLQSIQDLYMKKEGP